MTGIYHSEVWWVVLVASDGLALVAMLAPECGCVVCFFFLEMSPRQADRCVHNEVSLGGAALLDQNMVKRSRRHMYEYEAFQVWCWGMRLNPVEVKFL